MAQHTSISGLFEKLPTVGEINRRLVENVREKRMLVQLKKLAEQRQRLDDARRDEGKGDA